jgi:hypothetical protein
MGEVVKFKPINRTRLLSALETFVWDIGVPEAYYDMFCVGLMRLVLEMEKSGGNPYVMPDLPDKKRKKRKRA